MIKKALAVAVATGALLAVGAGAASAAPNPDGPGQSEETCVTMIEFPLPIVEPPARAEFRVCQEAADPGDGQDDDQPPMPAPLG